MHKKKQNRTLPYAHKFDEEIFSIAMGNDTALYFFGWWRFHGNFENKEKYLYKFWHDSTEDIYSLLCWMSERLGK